MTWRRGGYSRDQRSDCKQVVLALVVRADGFPLWHETWAGNKADSTALPQIVEAVGGRFGTARRIWVVDRGLASAKSVAYLKEHGQSFLVGTPKGRLSEFEAELCTRGLVGGEGTGSGEGGAAEGRDVRVGAEPGRDGPRSGQCVGGSCTACGRTLWAWPNGWPAEG